MNSPRHLFFLCLLWAFGGCITPPSPVTSKVVQPEELRVVVLLDNGRQLALGGRPDLAEKEYRTALRLSTNRSNIYNDVGFVLHAQGRDDEALLFYKRALEVDPYNFAAQDNTARSLYRLGRFEEAVAEYQKLLNSIDTAPLTSRENLAEDWGPKRLAEIHRNLATVNYVLGNISDALCDSSTALALDDSSYQLLLHERLLLAIEQPSLASTLLAAVTEDSSPDLSFDQGLALYSLQKFPEAAQSFSHALSSPDVDQGIKKNSSLMHLLVATKQNDRDAVRLFSSSVLDDYPELCESQEGVLEHYWPQRAIEDVQALLKKICPYSSLYVAGGKHSGLQSSSQDGKFGGILGRILDWPLFGRTGAATLN